MYNMLPSIRNCSSSQAEAKVGGGSPAVAKVGGGSQAEAKVGGGSQAEAKVGGGSPAVAKVGGGSPAVAKVGGGSQAEAKAGASYECPVDMTMDDDDVPTVELIVDAFYDFDGLSTMTNWCRQTFNVVPGTTTVQQLADTYMHLPVHNGEHFEGHPLTHMICHTSALCDLDKRGGLIGRFSPVSMTDRIVKNGQLLRLYVGPRVLVHFRATYVRDSDLGFETIKLSKFVPLYSTFGAAIAAFVADHPSEDTMQQLFTYQIVGGPNLFCNLEDVIEHDGTLVLSFL